MFSPESSVKAFKILAIVEACTWAGLLVGMFLKYVTNTGEQGVQIFGPIHGTAFILYVLSVAAMIPQLKWNWKLSLVALFAAIPPFGTIIFERWAQNSGHLKTGILTKV